MTREYQYTFQTAEDERLWLALFAMTHTKLYGAALSFGWLTERWPRSVGYRESHFYIPVPVMKAAEFGNRLPTNGALGCWAILLKFGC